MAVSAHRCAWLADLPEAPTYPKVETDLRCDWLVVGGGYTGLSAARKLAELHPNHRVVLIDSGRVGQGASSRNSGYLVDSTLNDGHLNNAGLQQYQQKFQLFTAGIEAVRELVNEYRIECDWTEAGKYHAAHSSAFHTKLDNFSNVLTQCGIRHDVLDADALANALGTRFYTKAVRTDGGVLLHPAKLARGMMALLEHRVEVFEHSKLESWKPGNQSVVTRVNGQTIHCKKLLLCANGYLPKMGVGKHQMFPLTLTASMTRPLTDEEYRHIGHPIEWGVLSASSMGATVRLTSDRRIMIRNTAESRASLSMSAGELALRRKIHWKGLQKRFPFLSETCITHTWSGVTAVSRNSANLFQRLDDRVFVAGCYNGGGIGLATLFGEQLAFKADGVETPQQGLIENRPKPTRLPPQPFLSLGVKTRLMHDRWQAVEER